MKIQENSDRPLGRCLLELPTPSWETSLISSEKILLEWGLSPQVRPLKFPLINHRQIRLNWQMGVIDVTLRQPTPQPQASTLAFGKSKWGLSNGGLSLMFSEEIGGKLPL